MHLTGGRHSRQWPYWLFVGLMVFCLLFTVTSAAPTGTSEITLASDDEDEGATGLRHRHGKSSVPEHASSSDAVEYRPAPPNRQSTPFEFAYFTDSRGGIRPSAPIELFTWNDVKAVTSRTSQRLAKGVQKLRSAGASSVTSVKKWVGKDPEAVEARRLERLKAKHGDIEIDVVHRLSKEEREARVTKAMSAPQYLPQEVELSDLRHTSAQGSKSAGRKALSPEQLKALVLSAPPQTQPSTAGTGLERVSSSAEVGRGRTLSRVPSDDGIDRKILEAQARDAERKGQPVIQDVLHVKPLPRILLRPWRKRGAGQSSSAQDRILGSLQYDCEGWRMIWNHDRSEALFHVHKTYGAKPVFARPFDQLSAAEKDRLLNTIPVVKKLRRYNWDLGKIKENPEIGAGFDNGPEGIYMSSSRLQQVVKARERKGQVEWGYISKSGARKWKKFDQIPDHLQEFVKWNRDHYAPTWLRDISHVIKKRSPTASTLRKRGNTSSSQIKSVGQPLQYKVEGWSMVWDRYKDEPLFAYYKPHSDLNFELLPFDELREQDKQQVQMVIPNIIKLKENGWKESEMDKAGIGRDASQLHAGSHPFPGKFGQIIVFRDNKGRLEVGYIKKLKGARKWKPYEELPGHLQEFLQWSKQNGANTEAWLANLRFRKRSFPASHFRKRAGGDSSSTSKRPLATYEFLGNGWTMYQYNKHSPIEFAPFAPYSEGAWSSGQFHQMDASQRQQIEATIPSVETLKVNGWNARRLGLGIGQSATDPDGVYFYPGQFRQKVHVRPGKPGLLSRKKAVYEFGYRESLDGERKWVRYEKLPDHLKPFLQWQKAATGGTAEWFKDVPPLRVRRSLSASHLRKRAGGESSRSGKIVDTLNYQCEGWLVHQQRKIDNGAFVGELEDGNTLFTSYHPHKSDQPIFSRKFSDWNPQSQRSITDAIQPLHNLQKEGGVPDNLWRYRKKGLVIGKSAADLVSLRFDQDHAPQTILVRSRRTGLFWLRKAYEFEHAAYRKGPREWVRFEALPEHLQHFLKTEAATRARTWVKAIPHPLRKRSITSSHLRKRMDEGSSSSPIGQYQKLSGPTPSSDGAFQTLIYEGEGWRRIASQDRTAMFYVPYRPHRPSLPREPRLLSDWDPEAKRQIKDVFPQAHAIDGNRVEIQNLVDIGVTGYQFPPTFYGNRFRQPIQVRKRSHGSRLLGTKTNYEFEHAAFYADERKWVPFQELPLHLKEFLKDVADRTSPVWKSDIPRRLKRMSLASLPFE